jgi:hypothetical protein
VPEVNLASSTAPPARREDGGCLDPAALQHWLAEGPLHRPDGGVLSWWDEARTGYPYPEAAALWLTYEKSVPLFAGAARRAAVERWLTTQAGPEGGFGRHGRQYLFDTAVVLRALLGAAEVAGRAVEDAFRFVRHGIEQGMPVVPPGAGQHWSECLGPHLLKCALALWQYDEQVGGGRGRRLIGCLVDRLLPLFGEGRFVVATGADMTYAHAHCYALEGLLFLRQVGCRDFSAVLRDGAVWLSEVQEPGGGIRSFSDGRRVWGEPHADTTAQAVRLWTALDREAFAGPIRAALGFLGRLQAESGAVRYAPNLEHHNTWAGIFTAQAVAWRQRGAVVGELI